MSVLTVNRQLYPHETVRQRPSMRPEIAHAEPKPPGSFFIAATCCAVVSFTPLILFVAFLLMEPMPEDATLPRAPIPGFARHKNANCDYATQAAMTNVSDPAQCAKACEQEMGCVGFVHSRRKRRCWRKTACTPLRPSSRVSTYLRRGVALPALPSRENPHEWALNTTLVLVWRGRDLSFLARLPARRVELVVYMLPVPEQPAASNRSASLSKYPHRWYGTSLTGTAAYRAEHEVRRWGQPLAFLRQLPHARSLADALPLGIVTFVLEFYHSLPKEVIFTDDRGCPGESCPWLLSLLPTPPPAAMNDAKRAFLAAYIAGGGERGNKDDFGPSEPADDRGLLLRCRCRLGSAAALPLPAGFSHGDAWRTWYSRELGAPAGAALRPEGGSFAVAGWRLRRRPYATWRALQSLLLVSGKYGKGLGTPGMPWQALSADEWAALARALWFSFLSADASAEATPRDPCFSSAPICDAGVVVRVRERAREFYDRVDDVFDMGVDGVEHVAERVRGGVGVVREAVRARTGRRV